MQIVVNHFLYHVYISCVYQLCIPVFYADCCVPPECEVNTINYSNRPPSSVQLATSLIIVPNQCLLSFHLRGVGYFPLFMYSSVYFVFILKEIW